MPKGDPAGYLPNVKKSRAVKKLRKKRASRRGRVMAENMAAMKSGGMKDKPARGV